MLSEEALGALLITRSAYIDQPEYGIPDFRNIIEAHTPEGSPERAEWLAHQPVDCSDASRRGFKVFQAAQPSETVENEDWDVED
jgi:hypothetical protein